MSSDYSRKRFKAESDFRGVLMQQGRVQVDAEWNEQIDIADRRFRAETVDLIGRCGVPEETPDGFKIELSGGQLTIGRGRMYVDGMLAENHGFTRAQLLERLEGLTDGGAAATLDFDTVLEEQRAAGPVGYAEQPYHPEADTLDPVPDPQQAPGTHLVYLDVWEREVTHHQRPSLVEPAIGVDTTARAQTVWQVRVLPDVGDDVNCATPLELLNGWQAENYRSDGRLSTGPVDVPGEPDPCRIPPRAQYKGEENHLYRVEVHTGGVATGTDAGATFKWSRDNAVVVSEVTAIPASDRVTVASRGRDDYLSFQIGDWVEVTDDWRQLAGQSGVIGRIAAFPAPTTLELNLVDSTLDLTTVFAVDTTDPDQPTDPRRRTRVIRWDHDGEVKKPDGTAHYDLDGAASKGVIPIPTDATTPLVLEDGVQITFETAAGGSYRVGDAWVFAARSAEAATEASIEELDRAPPNATHHHYCGLALVHLAGDPATSYVTDCRPIFPFRPCCCVVVRPGQDIQAAIDRLPPEGGHVSLQPGVHRLRRPLLIYGRDNITIEGCGLGTTVVFEPQGPAAQGAAAYVLGGSGETAFRSFTLLAWSSFGIVAGDGAAGVRVEKVLLVNPIAGRQSHRYAGLVGACVLLADCQRVQVLESTLVGINGIFQADWRGLAVIGEALGGPVFDDGSGAASGIAGAAPDRWGAIATGLSRRFGAAGDTGTPLPPLTDLRVEHNWFLARRAAIRLMDALRGSIFDNILRGADPDTDKWLERLVAETADRERRDDAADDSADDVGTTLAGVPDDGAAPAGAPGGTGDASSAEFTSSDPRGSHLGRLAGLGLSGLGPANAVDGVAIGALEVGIWAALIEDFELRANRMWSQGGVIARFARELRIVDNALHATQAGIVVGFGFDIVVRGNRIRVTPADVGDGPDEIDFVQDQVWDHVVNAAARARPRPSEMGLWLDFCRGARISSNEIDAPTGIGLSRSRGRVPASLAPSVLRILGIGRTWRLGVELGWVLTQAIALLRNSPGPDGGKPAFEAKLFAGFSRFLRDWVPSFVGKAAVTENRMAVDEHGVLFDQLLTLGGITIRGNRVAGFRRVGIRLHPAFSVGRVDEYASWVRCLFEWVLVFLRKLYDGLSRWLDAGAGVQPPAGPVTTGTFVGHMTSWFITLCGRVAGGGPGAGPGEDQRKTVAEDLKNAIGDLLAHASRARVDDFLAQSYRVSGNSLRGSGTGIWVGIDGARVDHNRVTIDPGNPVPYESIALGVLLGREPYEFPEAFMAQAFRDLDHELAFVWTAWDALQDGQAPSGIDTQFVDGFAQYVGSESALFSRLETLRQVLASGTDVDSAWYQLLLTLWRELGGYGIVIVGGDQVCHGNHVLASVECASLGRKDDRPWDRRPAVGGIWHFSNLWLWLTDILALFAKSSGRTGEVAFLKDPGFGGAPNREGSLALSLVALIALLLSRPRALRIADSRVDEALAHAIRTKSVYELSDVEVIDNLVRDAARFGIQFLGTGIGGLPVPSKEAGTVKVRGNTIARSSDAYRFSELGDLAVLDFARLLDVRNQNLPTGGWTALVSENHGTAEDLADKSNSAAHLATGIVSATDNHVITDTQWAFLVRAQSFRGLFAHNLSNKPNNLSGVTSGTNIENLPG